jgi:ligand-binding sensor domain-containing protein
LAAKGVYAIAEDSAGTLWFGTLGGVSRFVRTQ